MLSQWSGEDGAYVVTVPGLPGCMTHGDRSDTARIVREVAALTAESPAR